MRSRFIDLDRRFIEWVGRDAYDADFDLLPFDHAVGWEEILKLRRVVILAEAGGGKTRELEERARRYTAEGRYAFSATVQDVDRKGLERVLGARSKELSLWLQSDGPAWFFIDSVDEAKWDGIRLRSALITLAEGLAGNGHRAHIVLSSRISDWDFGIDLDTFADCLPDAGEKPPPAAPTREEIFRRFVRNEKGREPAKPQLPKTFLMAALDEPRVRAYSAAKGVPDLDAFLNEIETANLWRFARRPLDLGWMVDFWKDNRRLGTLSEMLEASLAARLKETNSTHGRRDHLDEDRCWKAIERIGASMVLGHADTIAIPSEDPPSEGERRALDLVDVLPDWSSEERGRLLGRAVFDPATYGRVRFHNDNKAAVRGYLAARWIARLKENNCPPTAIDDLLFADIYGLHLVKPSAAETAAWLSIHDESVAREVLARNPSLLLDCGDPGILSDQLRERALRAIVDRLVAGEQMPIFDHDNLRRFVTPVLAGPIQVIWEQHQATGEVRKLLMMMIALGRLATCVDIARDCAFNQREPGLDRVFAARAIVAMADEATKVEFANRIRANAAFLPHAELWEAVDGLFPRYLSISDLMRLYDSVPDESSLDLRVRGARWATRLDRIEDLDSFLTAVLARAKGGTVDEEIPSLPVTK